MKPRRKGGPYGPGLAPQHVKDLRDRAVSSAVARARGYRTVADPAALAALAELGFRFTQRRPGLLIPIWDVDGEIATYQLRPDVSRPDRRKPGKVIKYENPYGFRTDLDVPPGALSSLADPAIPLWITEGIPKADAAVGVGLCCIAVLGVWNWQKAGAPKAAWQAIPLKGRQVYICFDSDVMTKRSVALALDRLDQFLTAEGARVRRVLLPAPEGEKVGLDDFLAAHPVERLHVLAGDAREKKEPAAGRNVHPMRTWDDYGMADRVVDRYADRIRRLNDADKWAVYQGGVWILRNAEDQIRGLIRKTTEVLPDQERDSYPVEHQKKFENWVKSRRKSSADGATLQTLRTKKTIFASIKDFDRPGDNHLNCHNGVLDLDALTLAPHSPEHYFTRRTTADFVVGAEDKDWQEFLELALPDEEVRAYAQRIFGMALLDGNPGKLLVVLLGPADALKSAFLNLMLATLGDYGMAFNLSMLRAKQEAGPRSDLAERLPCRLIGAFEASRQWKLHADQIKTITGQDPIAARYTYDKVDTVRIPGYLPVIATNAMPTVDGADKALMRRLVVLPFSNSLAAERQDSAKAARMLRSPTVLAAALWWMAEGLRQYRAGGLGAVPLAVQVATQKSQRSLSIFDAFLHDYCEVGEGLQDVRGAFWSAYQIWCDENEVVQKERLNKNTFGQQLDDRYPARRKLLGKNDRQWVREGIRLAPEVRTRVGISTDVGQA